jgi:hypothetical protein
VVSLEVITLVTVLALLVVQGYLWNLTSMRIDRVEKKIKRVIDVMPRIQQAHFELGELKKERRTANEPLRQTYDDRIRKLEAEIERESQ